MTIAFAWSAAFGAVGILTAIVAGVLLLFGLTALVTERYTPIQVAMAILIGALLFIFIAAGLSS